MTLESYIASWLGDAAGAAGWATAAASVVHAALMIALFGALPLIYIWLERKVAGRIQDRLGPTRVGGKFGWLQTLADGIKLIQKEDLAPTAADNWIFRIAPYLAVVASFAAFMVLPLAANAVSVPLDTGVFLILALMSMEVLGIILAGYSSGSKWALFGAMREAAQMVSYEIPMALCVLIPLVIAGSLNFREVALLQGGLFTNWFVFHDPFTFLAFFTYFTVATASVKRAPFDLAEAESELVAGFHTEYSGLRWSFFFMAEYASMFAVSAIASLLFLGGWYSGIDAESWLVTPLLAGIGLDPATTWLGNLMLDAFGVKVMLIKGSLLVFVQIWVRWTLPRLRIDQVMTTCLKYLVPISCFLFLGAVLWPLILATTMGRTTLMEGDFAPPIGSKVTQQPQVLLFDKVAETADEKGRALMDGFSPTLEQFLFWVFSLMACSAAILVAATQNVVRMAFWLVISLGCVAALFFLLHADLLGATQLLIYVGGTVVVLIFGVMLTASGPYLKIQTSAGDLLMGAGVGVLLLALLINSVCSTDWSALTLDTSGTVLPIAAADKPEGGTARPLGLGFLGLRPDLDLGTSSDSPKLSPGYLLPFEIISVHLLVVLVGAAYLARAKRRACAPSRVRDLRLQEFAMETVSLNWYLLVGAVMFVCGIVCMATKRNGIGVLMGVELVLNGANLNFVAFSRFTPLGIDGQSIALFVIVLAAAEAAVALAIALNFYNNHLTIDVDRGKDLQG